MIKLQLAQIFFPEEHEFWIYLPKIYRIFQTRLAHKLIWQSNQAKHEGTYGNSQV